MDDLLFFYNAASIEIHTTEKESRKQVCIEVSQDFCMEYHISTESEGLQNSMARVV